MADGHQLVLHLIKKTVLNYFNMSTELKRVLLVGLLLKNIPTKDEIPINNIELSVASSIEEVKLVFEKNNNHIDIVISGGGIELEKRLEIVNYIFKTSNATSVHMKDIDSGPQGFIPFINKVLRGLLS
jgi:hypothetical protein